MLAIFWIVFLDVSYTRSYPQVSNCLLTTPDHLTCLNYSPSPEQNFSTNLKTLELRDIRQGVLDLDHLLTEYPEVENVSIYDGNISKIKYPKPVNKIKVLQLVRVGVENIGNKFLRNFPELETLNLQGNHIQNLGDLAVPKLKNLYVADNRWNCSMNLEWVLHLNQTVVKDLKNLTCFGSPYPNRNLLIIAGFTEDLKRRCPSYCACSLPKVFEKWGSERLEPVIEVNCSYRSLTELPMNLPKKSRIIRLEGNEIEDLKPLKHDSVYKKAFDLYLDNNKIRGIEELEGSYFLKHFRVFSLSGNKLTEVPTYALDNALEQNNHMPNALSLFLGGNPWRCDCVFTPVFQNLLERFTNPPSSPETNYHVKTHERVSPLEVYHRSEVFATYTDGLDPLRFITGCSLQEMLQKFAPQIQDLKEVKCSYVEGDENSLLPIIELSRSSVCRSPTEYSVQALDLLNGVLASLILLILGKLAYDYYYFKKTGRLPWIVTKMP